MHDIDYGRAETEAEFEQFKQWEGEDEQDYLEAGEFELEDAEMYEAEDEALFCANGEMCEVQETELAMELLEVTSEEELEEFIGNLARRAVRASRSILPSPDMKAVGGILKGAARKALPHIGRAVGRHVCESTGAKWGGRITGAAGKLFGLELEGLSGEDQEFEVARGFIRFAGNTVRNMTGMAGSGNPSAAARQAAATAAHLHAPGLLSVGKARTVSSAPHSIPRSPSGQSGRWMRRGNKIILYGM